jgi:hypothetical protein
VKALFVVSAIFLFLAAVVLFAALKGFESCYEVGRHENNKWWVAEKSTSHETRAVIHRRYARKFNHI